MISVQRASKWEGGGRVKIEDVKVNSKLDDIFISHSIVSPELIQTAEQTDGKPRSVYACKNYFQNVN